ncbi:ER degradation-enhancing alpha-mannosidase-like protein 2 [Coelomomyces lativittatus]|nr:ER degradation-enhancing alpha-mannosidase-like protein 2 [Coelomomyces lativittatus]KAJ1509148.1 ER degradation-enhancing alpha-mannosidase-like protein 2 [Coelomomyces lativittatus]KAJ1509827.1 ER degradation-enhancing alpha-mannosidase-like protein 2 [Coelomomyces lativittatus]
MEVNTIFSFLFFALIVLTLPSLNQASLKQNLFSKIFGWIHPSFNISATIKIKPTPLIDAIQLGNLSSFYIQDTNRLNISSIKQLVKEMFFHGWDNYLRFAYPHDDLKPISCTGRQSQGEYFLTLIDAADTLAIMDELEEFEMAINLIQKIPNFNLNINVSVFETTIRILGGLISTHTLAQERLSNYNGGILMLAKDLGNRLLWAFNSKTGVPYGTVNLMHGIPPQETPIVCSACATTLLLEFGYLSHLLNDFKYYNTAKSAILRLWSYRSPVNLLGKHFDAENAIWTEPISGISGQIDSFYEYLLKGYTIFHDRELYDLFLTAYQAIENFSSMDGWHFDVNMFSGEIISKSVSSLQAFWAGFQATFGDVYASSNSLKQMIALHKKYPFFPELVGASSFQSLGNNDYPLRPEFIETLYFFHSVTKDKNLEHLAFELIQRLLQLSYTPCGFASIQSVLTHKKKDHMESFFLSETLKYLYLLFDPNNYLHRTPTWVFTTEAHPLRVLANPSPFLNQPHLMMSASDLNFTANMTTEKKRKTSWSLEQCDRKEFENVKMYWAFLSEH